MRALCLASALVLGLLAGGMLLIGLALVPFWQSLPPGEFRSWFAAHASHVGRLMFPLGGGAALIAPTAAVAGRRGPAARWLTLAALAALGVLAITLAVNEPANERFAAPSGLSDTETSALLAHWIAWHWMRVAVGLVGFYAALRALQTR